MCKKCGSISYGTLLDADSEYTLYFLPRRWEHSQKNQSSEKKIPSKNLSEALPHAAGNQKAD